MGYMIYHSQRTILWNTFSIICTYYELWWKKWRRWKRELTRAAVFLNWSPYLPGTPTYHNVPEQHPSELWPSGHIHSPHQNINCSRMPCRGSNILSRGTGLTLILQMMGHNSRSRNCHRSRRYTTWRTIPQPQTASSWLNLHFSLVH